MLGAIEHKFRPWKTPVRCCCCFLVCDATIRIDAVIIDIIMAAVAVQAKFIDAGNIIQHHIIHKFTDLVVIVAFASTSLLHSACSIASAILPTYFVMPSDIAKRFYFKLTVFPFRAFGGCEKKCGEFGGEGVK